MIYDQDYIDNQPCSGVNMQFADIGHCYNASWWAYYSIDSCSNSASPSPGSVSASNPSSVSLAPYDSSCIAGTTTSCIVAPSTVRHSASASNSPSSVPNGPVVNAGAIVGGIFGASIGVGFLIGLFRFFCVTGSPLRRKLALSPKNKNRSSGEGRHTLQELAVPLH
jgi:hypothetical protein